MARFACILLFWLRSHSIALSMSPPDASSARLHSIIGMSVRLRSSLTAAAVIVLMVSPRGSGAQYSILSIAADRVAGPPSVLAPGTALRSDGLGGRRVRRLLGGVARRGRGRLLRPDGRRRGPRLDQRLLLRRQGGPPLQHRVGQLTQD